MLKGTPVGQAPEAVRRHAGDQTPSPRVAHGGLSSLPALKQMVYVSRAIGPVGPDTLADILHVARTRNGTAGVTGTLFHHHGRYLQYLEGPIWRVNETMARIRADPRHHDILTLLDGPVETRLFTDWDMANRPLDAESWARLADASWPTLTPLARTHPDGLRVLRALATGRLDVVFMNPTPGRPRKRRGRSMRGLGLVLLVVTVVAVLWPLLN